ncbi:alpha/beta fold hydrolase [Mycolicibacterium arenosum]|uniref:Alpha/beta fold hydrolase n=1 Tax=Mycolicibacterium arenosum TaxID=2952157 RepID=A0ABT1LXQ7_9MYCO|nr:alpha/beta fold hydrolase [Mycolicibacterium sp. CAU 1645]MCP9271125.1 alpha/beta fold hydrolase [Mycolicibacterium sp. CAU 1645]
MQNHTRPNLRPVTGDAEPTLHFRTIHGHRRAYRIAGSGPALLMIHGVGDDSATWSTVHAQLAQRFTVIAPDLLGHGESDKPRADYSLAAFANGMRDLLTALGIDRVTVVGHSLGGGVAAQFLYQYPQFVERVVLVAAGGVTTDVSPALKLVAMPMGAEALAALRIPGAVPALRLFGRAAKAVLGSTPVGRDIPDLLRVIERLRDPAALSAFSRTLRSAVDGHGQFVTMLDRSYLVDVVPKQIIWGRDDMVIPVSHARIAHDAMPGSELEIFEDSGHMPHHDHPDRFVAAVERFIDSTAPADYDQHVMASLLRNDPPVYAVSRGA